MTPQHQQQKSLTSLYLLGLLHSDGTFRCDIDNKSGNLKPLISLSSQSNSNTLELFKKIVEECALSSKHKKGKETISQKQTGRAPSQIVQGKNQVKKMLNFLQDEWEKVSPEFKNTIGLCGSTGRNFELLKLVCNKDIVLTKQEKLDIFYSFHKLNYKEEDIELSYKVPRPEREKRLNIQQGTSIKSAEKYLINIEQQCKVFESVLLNNINKIPNDYFLGLLDGDGGFNVFIDIKTAGHIEWKSSILFIASTSQKKLIELFLKKFSLENPAFVYHPKAILVRVYKISDIQKILLFIEENGGLIGDYKNNCYLTLKKLEQFRKEGKLYKENYKKNNLDLDNATNIKELKVLVDEIYKNTAIGRRKKRLISKDEVFNAILRVYGSN